MSERDQIIATLRAALPELRQRWPIQSLALFGSMVRGEAKDSSDVDLLIEFDKPIGLFSFIALEEEFAALVHRPVDLVTRDALKPFIKIHILAEALPL